MEARERILQQQLERERKRKQKHFEKLERQLAKAQELHSLAVERNAALNKRLVDAQTKEQEILARQAAWKAKMDGLFDGEMQVTHDLEKQNKSLHRDMDRLQRDRIAELNKKMDPIVIREGPSQATSYKIKIKYIQYETYPLQQRLKLTNMRLDSETLKRRAMEAEVAQLRDRISELTTRVNSYAPNAENVPLEKQTEKEKNRWKKFCKALIAVKRRHSVEVKKPIITGRRDSLIPKMQPTVEEIDELRHIYQQLIY